jgi:hypothetical protein
MTTAAPSTALATIQPAFTDAERLALAGFLPRTVAIGCCSAGIVIVVPVLCCSFTAPAGGVTLDR